MLHEKYTYKSLFTLIELIVVIVVVGILSVIVIPNISSFREDGERAGLISDARAIQTAVDVYALKHDGAFPTKERPTLGEPKIIETYGMKPSYLKSLPKNPHSKFWVDENQNVWGSLVDAPTNVSYSDGNLTWNSVVGSKSYRVYTTKSSMTSSLKGAKSLIRVGTVSSKGRNDEKPSLEIEKKSDSLLLVSAVDKFGFESAPTRIGTTYEGYGKGPDKDFFLILNPPNIVTSPPDKEAETPSNQKPTAVISMTPKTNLKTDTVISFNHSNSQDLDGDEISSVEWKNKQTTYPEGRNTVELRVMDSKGLWSDWTSLSFDVAAVPFTSGTFTNAGGIARYGPSPFRVEEAYKGTSLDGKVSVSSGIQSWTVPRTGKYNIAAYGAQGGSIRPETPGGSGAIMRGDFTLTMGTVLNVVVGQTPGVSRGGGGGTFVWVKDSKTPLIVAGGGGGSGGHPTAGQYAAGRSATMDGNGVNGGGTGRGGLNGYAGGAGASMGSNGLNGSGGGGAGWYSDAPGAFLGDENKAIRYGIGGTGAGPVGGFGGGGAGWHAGGGGGGYSGGGGGTWNLNTSAGGGGSFNLGTNRSNGTGNHGNGKVIFTYIGL